ncbi:MAG: type VI secretion system tip protein VgrG [Bacteroidetes bacterium]|nr:hypothetical protein AWN76_001480 [Rhodothermaceae bacterium RA]RMH49178.1 MAG: type VI secretion system tip protein VgrG [Bacteroidota bacterium]
MPELDANVSRFYFEAESLPADTFQVVRFSGLEELSHPFRFELTLVSEDPDIDFAAVVNHAATFTMLRGTERVPRYGIVSHLEQAGRTGDFFLYRAVLVPRLWRLNLQYQSRIFQHQSLPDILGAVFEEAGLSASDVRLDLHASYPPIEYCVQYRETDFNFVSRLMEREGLCYFFDHMDADVLVITDDRAGHPRIEDDKIPFRDGAGMQTGDAEFINELIYREQIVTGEVLVKDYNYMTPETTIEGTEVVHKDMPGRHYEYGDRAADTAESKRLARLQAERFECRRRLLRGRGNCVAFSPGFTFTLYEHYRKDLDAEYLITRVVHEGSQQEAMGGGAGFDAAGEQGYHNRFVAQPATVPYRPPRVTPVPTIPGLATARLESAGGEYAYIDEEGRYRVRFAFDKGDAAQGNASLPVRLLQPSAGPNYGTHLTSLAGAEVLLAFENGDINRPVIVGAAPNPSNKSPVVSENKMQNIIRTAGGNQLILDDTKEKAQITLNTPDNHRLFFDDDKDAILIETTKKHRVTLDDKNARIEVKTTAGHFVKMQDGKNAGEGRIDVQSEAGHRLTIDDKEKLMTMVDESGDNLFQIDIGNKKLTIKTAQGDIEMLAESGVIDIKGKTIHIESSADTTVKAGGNVKSEAGSNYEVKAGMDLKAEAGMNFSAEAGMNYTQKAGMNLDSEASMNHTIKGLMVKAEGSVQNDVAGTLVNVKASAVNTIQGALVKIN